VTARSSAVELSKHDKKIVQKYLSLLDLVPGPISVWVTTDEGLLHFYTLVTPGKEILRALIHAELTLLDVVDPLRVDFDIYEDAATANLVFANTPLLYQRS
jgi:hypothetical protein